MLWWIKNASFNPLTNVAHFNGNFLFQFGDSISLLVDILCKPSYYILNKLYVFEKIKVKPQHFQSYLYSMLFVSVMKHANNINMYQETMKIEAKYVKRWVVTLVLDLFHSSKSFALLALFQRRSQNGYSI